VHGIRAFSGSILSNPQVLDEVEGILLIYLLGKYIILAAQIDRLEQAVIELPETRIAVVSHGNR